MATVFLSVQLLFQTRQPKNTPYEQVEGNILPLSQVLLLGHEKGPQCLPFVVYSAAILWLFLFIHIEI